MRAYIQLVGLAGQALFFGGPMFERHSFQSYLQTRFACGDTEVVASAWAHAYTSRKSPSCGSVAGCCYASTARRDGDTSRRSIMSKQKTVSGRSSNSIRSIRAIRSAGHWKFSIRLVTTNLGLSNGTEGGAQKPYALDKSIKNLASIN